MPNDNRFAFITPEDYCSIYDDTPVSIESADVEDFYSDLYPYNLIYDISNDEIAPPRDREEFMNWYLARRLDVSSGMSSRDVQVAMQDAEVVWRFIGGEINYSNALDRRKGNAVVAVTIRC